MNFTLSIVAFFFFCMGLGAIVKPKLAETIMKLGIDNAVARNEVRAVYGGFGLFTAILLVVSPQLPELQKGIILTVAISLAGMASGRVVSFFIEKPTLLTLSFFLGETVLTGLLLSNII